MTGRQQDRPRPPAHARLYIADRFVEIRVEQRRPARRGTRRSFLRLRLRALEGRPTFACSSMIQFSTPLDHEGTRPEHEVQRLRELLGDGWLAVGRTPDVRYLIAQPCLHRRRTGASPPGGEEPRRSGIDLGARHLKTQLRPTTDIEVARLTPSRRWSGRAQCRGPGVVHERRSTAPASSLIKATLRERSMTAAGVPRLTSMRTCSRHTPTRSPWSTSECARAALARAGGPLRQHAPDAYPRCGYKVISSSHRA